MRITSPACARARLATLLAAVVVLLPARPVAAQAQHFDIVTFTLPSQWDAQSSADVLTLTRTEAATRAFCRVSIFPSQPVKGPSNDAYQQAWTRLLARPTRMPQAPATAVGTTDGTQFLSATADANDVLLGPYVATLRLYLPGDRSMAVLITASSRTALQLFSGEVDALTASFRFGAPVTAATPAPAAPAPATPPAGRKPGAPPAPLAAEPDVEPAPVGGAYSLQGDWISKGGKQGPGEAPPERYLFRADGSYESGVPGPSGLAIANRVSGRYALEGNRLVLKRADGTTQEYAIVWVGEREFLRCNLADFDGPDGPRTKATGIRFVPAAL